MKKTYKILVPDMLPMHFDLITKMLSSYGYDMEVLTNHSPSVAETGLKYVHNDTCYPAILVIGQFIEALESGKYDPHKTALIYFQTGGGCRASNYIFLLRKALEKAGYSFVPVISLSMNGLEKHPGFTLSAGLIIRLFYCIFYGDLIMSLKNQVAPYEINKGDAEKLALKITAELGKKVSKNIKTKLIFHQKRANTPVIFDINETNPDSKRNTICIGLNDPSIKLFYFALAS